MPPIWLSRLAYRRGMKEMLKPRGADGFCSNARNVALQHPASSTRMLPLTEIFPTGLEIRSSIIGLEAKCQRLGEASGIWRIYPSVVTVLPLFPRFSGLCGMRCSARECTIHEQAA